MKKVFLSITFLLLCTLGFTMSVKFSVDMRYQEISANGVHVSGDFQIAAGYPGNWEPNTTVLTNEPGTSIYSVVVNIPANAKYEYRFINGDQEYESEFIPEKSRVGFNFNDNRWVFIDSSTTTLELPSLIFGGNAAYGKKLVRLTVDMQKQNSVANVSSTTSGMYSFYDKIYEAQIYSDSDATVVYAFSNNGSVESLPVECNVNGFRELHVTSDTIAATVCFASCTDCSLTSVNENRKSKIEISVYPNPINDLTKVYFANSETRNIYLYDVHGNKCKEYLNSNSTTLVLDNKSLSAGMYILNVQQNGISENIKLIVQ